MTDVRGWLAEQGLEQYAEAFVANAIDRDVLRTLTGDDLKELGVSALGHRKKLLAAIALLSEAPMSARPPEANQTPTVELSGIAERRQLTVLFCDLVGSTVLATTLDPEDLRQVIGTYHRCIAEVISRFEGHVAKYLGDGVLAYFGYPKAHEDDAERAVHAGLELVEAVGALTPRAGPPLQARIGIATGVVVVGDLLGEGAAREEAVVGETPNLAARLQALAAPNSVVIGPGTRRLVGGLFDYADLGQHALKGFAASVRAWRVLGPSAAEGRFEALRGLGLTPLIGREHEIGLLLDRWEQAKEGEGQVVLLSGEPGVGKSRLLRAFRERLADEPYTPLSHYGSPYHQNTALYPVVTLLERAAGLSRGDRPARRLEKLESLLRRSATNLDEAVPLAAALLSIPPDGERYAAPNLTPQRQKQRTLEILVEQVAGLAADRPVLSVYEDVHWADPSTLELLGMVADRVQRLPVLVVMTFRPEFTPPWTGYAHVTALTVGRLPQRRGAAMIEQLTGGKPLPPEVVEQILAKTDGVPLFVEELTKAVLESGLVRDDGGRYILTGPLPPLAIPATLQDSLMARLDRLAPVKEVAQIGAVIGREFWHELLAAIADRPEDQLLAALDQLVSAELIFRRGAPPQAQYSFKHALVQDAAYESMLRGRRQQLHARIAQTLCSSQGAGQAESSPEVVAEHFTRAGMYHEAARYWLRAGERAKAAYANREATSHLNRCLGVLSQHADAPPPVAGREAATERVEVTALALLGDLAGLAGDVHAANQRYDEALARCQDDDLRTWISNKHHHPRSTRRDGAKITFYTHGSGQETLLLVNPLVYGLALFQPLLERLCQEFRIVTVDCRGTGGSDPLTRPFYLREHALDVAAVIEALGGRPVIGVGLSRGSNLLIMLAASRPDLVGKLVTVGCPLAPKGWESLATYSGYWEQCPAAHRRGDVEALLRILGSFMYNEPGTEELKRLLVERGLRLPPDTVLSFYDPDPEVDVDPLLGRVTVPTLVTHGDADQLIPFSSAEYLAGELPNALLYNFKGKGHLPIFTATDEFCAVLRSFVRMGTLP